MGKALEVCNAHHGEKRDADQQCIECHDAFESQLSKWSGQQREEGLRPVVKQEFRMLETPFRKKKVHDAVTGVTGDRKHGHNDDQQEATQTGKGQALLHS